MALRLNLGERYPRDVWLLSAATGLGAAGFLGLRQLLNALYLLRLGFGADVIGTVFAVGAISFSLSSVPGGALGTRLGPRRTMILGALVNMAGMSLLPLTELVPPPLRFLWVLLSQIIGSSGWSFFSVNLVAAMAGFTTPANRRGAYALNEAFSGLGSFLGAFIGGFLPGLFANLLGTTTEFALPYRYALWGALVFAAAGLVPLTLAAPTAVAPRSSTTTGRFHVGLPLALLVATALLNNGSYATSRAFGTAYLDTVHRLPTSLIGTVNSAAMFLAIVMALGSTRLSRGRSSGGMMAWASLGMTLSMLCMGLVPHWAGGALGIIGVHTSLALWRPSFQALQMEIAEPRYRSLVSGATAMGMSLGFGSVSYSGGLVVTRWGYHSEFLLGAGLATASAAVVMLLASRLRRAAGTSSAEGQEPPAATQEAHDTA